MKKSIVAALVSMLPAMAFAQTSVVSDVNSLSAKLIGIGNTVTYILTALAVIFIVWQVVIYLIKGAGEEGRTKAGMNILWGIVGLFVIVSIWGLVSILTNTFRTAPTNQPIPNFGNNASNGGIPANQVPQVQ
jgi:hypothetical protein